MLPNRKYTGAATSAVTLSPDGDTLYAVNSGANSIAVIPLSGKSANKVSGLIPTAYEPHDITFAADGSWMYIISGKSSPGRTPITWPAAPPASPASPTPAKCRGAASRASNEYQFQLNGRWSAPGPGSHHLEHLTEQVAKNNFY